jgi:uncharacterized membrane protein
MDSSGGLPALPATAAPRRARFVAFHKADRTFFLIFLLVCWLGVIMGFYPPVLQRFNGNARFPAPLVLRIHAVAFSSWLLLLTAQILLVRTRRTALHMKLGMVGVALVPIMGVSAYFSEVYTQRWHLAHPPDNFAFFIVPIFWVVGFTSLAAAALFLRKNPSVHKRLILLATTLIVGAAYDRWWGDALTRWFGDGLGGMLINTYTATNLILFAALAYDLWSRGRLHRVYEVVVPVILLSEITTSLIYHSPKWLPVARSIVTRSATLAGMT